jgi:predicted transcriptional regulator
MTLTVHPELEKKLAAVAGTRDPQTMLEDALAAYVAREERIVAGIRKGLEQAERGEGIPHTQVMAELDEILAQAERRR